MLRSKAETIGELEYVGDNVSTQGACVAGVVYLTVLCGVNVSFIMCTFCYAYHLTVMILFVHFHSLWLYLPVLLPVNLVITFQQWVL